MLRKHVHKERNKHFSCVQKHVFTEYSTISNFSLITGLFKVFLIYLKPKAETFLMNIASSFMYFFNSLILKTCDE